MSMRLGIKLFNIINVFLFLEQTSRQKGKNTHAYFGHSEINDYNVNMMLSLVNCRLIAT